MNIFWSTSSPHVFRFKTGTKNHIILGLENVNVMCAIQCCSQLLLWPSQLCWQSSRLFYTIKMAHTSAKEFCSKQLRNRKIKWFVSPWIFIITKQESNFERIHSENSVLQWNTPCHYCVLQSCMLSLKYLNNNVIMAKLGQRYTEEGVYTPWHCNEGSFWKCQN